MAMKSAPFRLTCVVADSVLQSKGRNRCDSMKWYLSFVIRRFSGDENDEHTSTDFSRVLKGGRPAYGTRTYVLLRLCLR